MCTSWSSANQISNFKFSAFFRVLFALWSLKYPHPKSQQTPRVSTELEMVVNLSYSFIPLQKLSQKGVDRSVENPQKCAEPYTVPIARRAEQIYLAHQNYLLLPRIWLACAEPYTVPIARRGIKMPFSSQDMIGQKDPSFYVRGRRRAGSTSCLVEFHILAAMSLLLRGKIFCSYGSNFLKSHTFTKMTLRFSSQNLPRWRRFSLTSKKILQVAVVAGTMTATVCRGIIYWSSGTIDSN